MALPDLAVGLEFDSDLFNTLPKSLVYYGNRTSTAGPTSTNVTLGVLRLDNMNLLANRAYWVTSGNLRPALTTQTDRAKIELRYNSAGTATTSSSEIGRVESIQASGAVSYPPVSGFIVPPSDTAVGSVLLTLVRASGAGTITLPPDTGGLHLFVFDLGIHPGDTGVDV